MNGIYGELQKQLQERQVELQQRLDNIKKDRTKKNSADWAEQAQERENDEVLDALGNEATEELNLVHKALDRMKDDSYGVCLACNEEIPVERLKIMPYARYCVRCAELNGR